MRCLPLGKPWTRRDRDRLVERIVVAWASAQGKVGEHIEGVLRLRAASLMMRSRRHAKVLQHSPDLGHLRP